MPVWLRTRTTAIIIIKVIVEKQNKTLKQIDQHTTK